MTDITELAQSLKSAAEKATPGKWERGDGKNGGELLVYCDDALGSAVCEATSEYNTIPKYQRIDNLDFIALANPANILALVEALEKAQQRISQLESRTVTAAAADVLAERKRQVTTEGWTPEHDDQHVNFEMAIAGGLYAISAVDSHHKLRNSAPSAWPWDRKWWKPDGPRRDLVKAGALILAEIERLDRAAGIKVEAE
ncbi:ead/Ea22-like family protein [Klebsiella pneumoniae]|uniref:ead/Ea22-like family protein n=1 Tax=Klebsiella pneumoniae TaxID=573 RepID=UPI003309257B|nr:ead/Ea22-like family protein [Klebsiella pneumoniae]